MFTEWKDDVLKINNVKKILKICIDNIKKHSTESSLTIKTRHEKQKKQKVDDKMVQILIEHETITFFSVWILLGIT